MFDIFGVGGQLAVYGWAIWMSLVYLLIGLPLIGGLIGMGLDELVAWMKMGYLRGLSVIGLVIFLVFVGFVKFGPGWGFGFALLVTAGWIAVIEVNNKVREKAQYDFEMSPEQVEKRHQAFLDKVRREKEYIQEQKELSFLYYVRSRRDIEGALISYEDYLRREWNKVNAPDMVNFMAGEPMENAMLRGWMREMIQRWKREGAYDGRFDKYLPMDDSDIVPGGDPMFRDPSSWYWLNGVDGVKRVYDFGGKQSAKVLEKRRDFEMNGPKSGADRLADEIGRMG